MIDYIALSNALLGSEVILPADPNQIDRALRYLAKTDRPGILALPRSPLPVLLDEEGKVIFGEQYEYRYGQADWIRKGSDAVVVTYGVMVQKALEAHGILKEKGISCGILNVTTPSCLDAEKIREAAGSGLIVVMEDHNSRSGLGSALGMFLAEQGIRCTFRCMGVERYGISAPPGKQFEYQHLTGTDLAEMIQKNIRNNA